MAGKDEGGNGGGGNKRDGKEGEDAEHDCRYVIRCGCGGSVRLISFRGESGEAKVRSKLRETAHVDAFQSVFLGN